MNQKKSLLITLLTIFSILSYSTLAPIIYTNKTFMNIPTPHTFLPMKYSTWHRIIKQGSSADTPWNATVHVAPFYHNSNNKGKMGKYFGTNNKNVLTVGRFGPNTDIQGNLIIHANSPSDPAGELKLDPEHTAYGAYFSYHQKLEGIHKGLFLQVNVPLEHVENDLHMSTTVSDILNYFKGDYEVTSGATKQEKLTHAKLDNLRSKSGVADIEVMLGYKLADKKEHEVNGAIKLQIPTGNRPTGEYIFDAIVGNNRHWGLGGQFDASMNISKGDDYSLEFITHLDYMYFFKADEKRTLGYRNGYASGTDPITSLVTEDTPTIFPWAHYILGGEDGKAGTFPLANVLTRDVDVTPGGQVKGMASFAYHRNNTTIDFGYSFLARESEKVTVKQWDNNKYGPAIANYNATNTFNYDDPTNDILGGPIQQNELETRTPSTPGFLKHSLHLALGYTLSEWENPFTMGCGASVSWMEDNSNTVGYTLWLKFGATF